MLAEANAAQAKLAHIGPRAARFNTPIGAASGAGIAWQLGQAFLVTQLFELLALSGVFIYHLWPV